MTFTARAFDVDMLRADALVHALKNLKALHMQMGKVSHAKGVQSAIDLVQRTVRAGRAIKVENYAGIFDHQHAIQATHASDAQS